MTKLNEVYKCQLCGNIIETVHVGAGELVCCNQSMGLQIENTVETSTEKHIPIIAKIDNGYKVTVGETLHPMETEHYVEWVELVTKDKVYKQYLAPKSSPEAKFFIQSNNVKARAYCNLHGLWSSNN